MATTRSAKRNKKKNSALPKLPENMQAFFARRIVDTLALLFMSAGLFLFAALSSYYRGDPSLNTASAEAGSVQNWMGIYGSTSADALLQTLGAAGFLIALTLCIWGLRTFRRQGLKPFALRVVAMLVASIGCSIAFAQLPSGDWLPHAYLGGASGTLILNKITETLSAIPIISNAKFISITAGILSLAIALYGMAIRKEELRSAARVTIHTTAFICYTLYTLARNFYNWVAHYNDPYYEEEDHAGKPGKSLFQWPSFDFLQKPEQKTPPRSRKKEPQETGPDIAPIEIPQAQIPQELDPPAAAKTPPAIQVVASAESPARANAPAQHRFALNDGNQEWTYPSLDLIEEEQAQQLAPLDENALRRNAELLQNVLSDFKIEGDIVKIHPGPVVTLYELEPAPGTKSSRVISLSDDIARSMAAISVRCAVVPGRNVIGIELPNKQRQIVYMRELLASRHFEKTSAKLPLILGKDIGGQPILADLAKMPHLLVAGTTGSGKSVAVNTMILSLLYSLPPEKCRFIMIDPKMLELSVYDGVPHLLSPVVTEPGKAVVALKWTVQEMEERYRAMSKLGVRNIEGYNQRIREARKNGETIMRKVCTGFDPETGKEIYEDQPMDLTELPYIVVVVDEFADLMLVAGKDVENAIQRLAQMARAAGIHLIMATQRPSVDVITGVIKANFPTRISFAVTSKIDSRTILGEGGAEQLLGMGDMLYMAPGGRITRVHGPFVADEDVEKVVNFLKSQAEPAYMTEITEGGDFGDSEVMGALFGDAPGGGDNNVDELYDQAVAVVAREGKASTSFIQRHLQIGYNRAARIIEEMERQGVVSPANATGKRQILVQDHSST